jgi:predicted amidohydrolase YtcJ
VFIAAATTVLMISLSTVPGTSQFAADLIITGGRIYTLEKNPPIVESVAVREGRIVYAGASIGVEPYRGAKTVVIDARGLAVLPGLIDAHGHLEGLGNFLADIDLTEAASPSDARRLVLERMASASPGDWIEGRGWDQNDWSVKDFPTWKDLEGTEANPVYLRRVDGHAAWVNRRALEVCSISRDTPDPAGGRILRSPNGDPTGILVDNAVGLVSAYIPELSFDERVRRMKLALGECLRFGLTSVHDAGVGEKDLEVFRHLDEKNEMGLRVYAMIDADEPVFAERQLGGPPSDHGNLFRSRLTVSALKLYADGALGSRGAALFDPYSDDPGNRGLLVHTRQELLRWTLLAMENGFQVCTHAIGDSANRLVLDVYEEAMRRRPLRDPRFRIEHAQVLATSDIEHFARLGVIASMQPTHATSDMYWAEDRLGPKRIAGAYAWRKLMDAGCAIACGSDFPVENPNPLWGIYAAVTRRDRKGLPEGGWRAEECMTMGEAIDGFTKNAAYAGFMEHVKGTIQQNMAADFTVLDTDPFEESPQRLLEARVVYTIVGGEVLYDAHMVPAGKE